MGFIRIKEISNNKYAYVVESISTDKGPRQKVKKYLGRIHEFEKKSQITTKVKNNFLQMIIDVIEPLGFKEKKGKFYAKKIIFDPLTKSVSHKNGKEAIISSNQGYLCSFTLQRLANFKKTGSLERDAPLLAKYFIEAGLIVSKDSFVKFYQSL